MSRIEEGAASGAPPNPTDTIASGADPIAGRADATERRTGASASDPASGGEELLTGALGSGTSGRRYTRRRRALQLAGAIAGALALALLSGNAPVAASVVASGLVLGAIVVGTPALAGVVSARR